MRNDLNFFSAYQGKKRERKDDRKIIYAIATVLMALIIGTLAYNSVNLYIVGSDIEDYKAKLSDKSFQDKLNETIKIEKKLSTLKVYDIDIASLTSAIESRTAVSSKVLNALSSTLPTEVSLSDIKVDKNEITMKAVSTRRSAIGELEYNITQLDIIQDVHVSSIVDKDSSFSCDIKCALKDVV